MLGSAVRGQVGKGIADLNSMPEAALSALPGMTPAVAKAFVTKRPFASITEANAFLLSQKLTQRRIRYTRRSSRESEHGTREDSAHSDAGPHDAQFSSTSWKTWAQFDKEIGKYVGKEETDRLKQFVFIPTHLNTATDEDILSIPGAGQKMVHEFKEYRPWKTQAQFEKEIGKYVGAKETARLWRYVVIQ
jgi:DNA uptake protein ComE-like DNA-binding protein